MATRSNIICKVGESYTHSYCHWDGFISSNGVILLENYNTQEKVEDLVNKGYLSSLDADINSVSLISSEKEANYNCRSPIDYPEDYINEEFNYLWDGEKWLVSEFKSFRNSQWRELSIAVENMWLNR